MNKINQKEMIPMNINAYKTYIDNSNFSKEIKNVFYELINSKEEGSDMLVKFFEIHSNYNFHWATGKTDKEHAISYLISTNLCGNQERQFYANTAGIILSKNNKEKNAANNPMKVIRFINTDKTNVGMFLWLIDHYSINLDWNFIFSLNDLLNHEKPTELNGVFFNILKAKIEDVNELLKKISKIDN